MHPHLYLWIAFGVIVMTAMAVDLGLKSHRHRTTGMPLKEASLWCALWISLALGFGIAVYFLMGPQRAMEYFTAYLLEESLSVDNMFVFVLIFKSFGIPAAYQHRVLKYGILGAIVMRFILIFTGVALVQKFHWMLYVFGAILVLTAFRMLKEDEEEIKHEENIVLNFFKKFIPVKSQLDGDRFFSHENGRWHMTPLFAALLVVEVSDLIFAVDSIPAVLVISSDPFIIFTSNVFAIMGLRALYFVISGVIGMFRFLRFGLAFVLAFIGVKMLISHFIKIPIGVSLSVVGSVIAISILLSVLIKEKPAQ